MPDPEDDRRVSEEDRRVSEDDGRVPDDDGLVSEGDRRVPEDDGRVPDDDGLVSVEDRWVSEEARRVPVEGRRVPGEARRVSEEDGRVSEEGRWVLVTGASRGIGRSTALALAADGYRPVLWARSGDDLADAAREVRAHGVPVRTAVVDVADPAAVARAAAVSLAGLGTLAGLVLNAGQGVWSALSDLEPAVWDRTVRTNLDGGFHVLTAVLPRLIAAPGALVVGLLSDSALYPFPQRAAYASSKAGLRALLEVTRREVRDKGVRVCQVLPSRVDTYFHGAHTDAAPGSREGALAAADVAAVIAGLFRLPPHVEVREIQMSSLTSTFGPFPEKAPA
ncbi:SDR family NAD(P)-dependent oxidoreductase [Streptomyces sp. NPDC088258]|uniref:SDR family NAD(P)-dependent oxidoreductase n=1 Tax=Streptomyces sp. NPDC088258 TaxID=3365849 RepID=UPI00381A8388